MILRVLFFVLFFVPLFFQIFFGLKTMKGKLKLKLWQVSVISLLSQILVTAITSYLMSIILTEGKFSDGLPMIGVIALNLILGGLVLFVSFIQSIINYWRKQSTSNSQ